MSETESTKVQLTPEEKRERRKQQLREAQRRFYANHKKKEKGNPASYDPDYLREYHKNYYQANRDRLNSKAKERYQAKKSSSSDSDTPLTLPSTPILIHTPDTFYNC